MSPRRVLAEVRRELLRPSSLWSVPAVLGFCLVLGLFALSENALELYTPAVYLLVPMFALPLAAHRAARDRERDLAAAHATTPLTLAEVLVGKLAALSLLLCLVLLSTVPMLYVMVHQAATEAFVQLTPFLAWALAIGLVSLVVGLGVGLALGGRGVSALSAGFAVVAAWFLVAVLRRQVLGLATSEFVFEVLQVVVYASPFTWGLEALAPEAPYLVGGHGTHLGGLALLLAALLAGLVALVLGFQRMTGWRAGISVPPVAAGVLATSLLAAGAVLAMAEPLEVEAPAHPPVAEAVVGDVHVRGGVAVEGAWAARTPAVVHVTFTGHPNATVELGPVGLEGSGFSTRDPLVAPSQVVLDHVIPAPDHAPPGVGERAGTAHVPVETVLTAQRIHVDPVLHLTLEVDGQPVVLTTQQSASDWRTPTGATMGTGATTLILAVGLALHVPRRLNRW